MEPACHVQHPCLLGERACLISALKCRETPRTKFCLAAGDLSLTCDPVFSRKGTEFLLCYFVISKVVTHRSPELSWDFGQFHVVLCLQALVDQEPRASVQPPHAVPSDGLCLQSQPTLQVSPAAHTAPACPLPWPENNGASFCLVARAPSTSRSWDVMRGTFLLPYMCSQTGL